MKVVSNRAHLSNEDFAEVRAAGFDDEHIVEILAHVALNIFTNYINVAFEVPVDFPRVALNPAAQATDFAR
ncbi:MAG: carboxymuconolactone decarboxylase [Polaromonas sp.]|nr:carboxymuconolactone decarboxylase [Polaromonas sp.]